MHNNAGESVEENGTIVLDASHVGEGLAAENKKKVKFIIFFLNFKR